MPIKKVIQSYHVSEVRGIYFDEFHGFGDHLRGCIFLQQLCSNRGYDLQSSYSSHKLRHYLHSDVELSKSELDGLQRLRTRDRLESVNFESDRVLLFSNHFPNAQITPAVLKAVKDRFLRPKDLLLEKLQCVEKSLGLDKIDYDVLHLRIGDDSMSGGVTPMQEAFLSKWATLQFSLKRPTVLLTDSATLRHHNCFQSYIKTGLEVGHLGLPETSINQVEGSILEFFIIMGAKNMYQYSVYSWGSGFSQFAALLGGVPAFRFNL